MSLCVYYKYKLCKNVTRCPSQVLTKDGISCRENGELSDAIEKESPGPDKRRDKTKWH